MAVDLAPVRHRRETVREQNLRMEYAALRHDAITHCDFVEPRLDALYPVAIELGPREEQLVGSCLYSVDRLRKQATR